MEGIKQLFSEGRQQLRFGTPTREDSEKLRKKGEHRPNRCSFELDLQDDEEVNHQVLVRAPRRTDGRLR